MTYLTQSGSYLPGTRMEQLVNSAVRLCGNMSLLAISQFKTALSIDAVSTHSSRASLVDAQGESINDSVLPEVLSSRYLMKTGFQAARQCLGVVRWAAPPVEWTYRLDEINNKLEAFGLFEYVDLELDLSGQGAVLLPYAVRHAQSLGSYRSVWATEGIGHYYANSHLAHSKNLRELMPTAQVRDLPATSLAPLHAGIGLALAESLLNEIRSQKKGQDGKTVGEFISLCKDMFLPDYLEIIYEALGLATRMLHPQLISQLHRSLSCLSEELHDYFWHGIGRALYFAPSTFLPHQVAQWQAFQLCVSEAPNGAARSNVVAGFTWALTLVNIRHPQIVAVFLRNYAKNDLDSDAIFNGMRSALTIWTASSASDDFLLRFRQYEIAKADPHMRQLWDNYAVRACDKAQIYCHATKQKSGLGKLFRFQVNR